MKVILVMVMSVDGKTTKWNDPNVLSWTSIEDQKHFTALIADSKVVVMGRKTYDSVKSSLKLSPDHLRIVLTSSVQCQIHGQLEFTSHTPKVILKELTVRGYDEALLLGGSEVNNAFLKVNLINELWLTVEPKLFGHGKSLAGDEQLNTSLKLINIKKLNPAGTLLIKYRILKT